jgi:hypothetical protein
VLGVAGEQKSRVAVTGLVLVAGMYSLVAWTVGLVVVTGMWVVPDWTVSGSLLVIALVVRVVRRTGISWQFRVVAVVTALATLLSGLGELTATYTVLRSVAADGCRVAVRETAFLFAGSGEVYLTGPLGIGTRVGSYRTDDGYMPMSSGDYTFHWEAGIGQLHLTGRPGDPILAKEIDTLAC